MDQAHPPGDAVVVHLQKAEALKNTQFFGAQVLDINAYFTAD
jgi:hypothetical protein